MALYHRVAQQVTSVAEASRRTQKLYRHAIKIIPWLQDTYELDYPKKEMKDTIKAQFTKHAHVRDITVIGTLLFQGENDLQEAINVWKTRSHVVKFFEPVQVDKRSIVDRILAGERVMSDKFKLTEDHANWVYPHPKSTNKQQQ